MSSPEPAPEKPLAAAPAAAKPSPKGRPAPPPAPPTETVLALHLADPLTDRPKGQQMRGVFTALRWICAGIAITLVLWLLTRLLS